MLSSKGQFASNKLSINHDTWIKHESAMLIEIKGKGISIYNKGNNEVWTANDYS